MRSSHCFEFASIAHPLPGRYAVAGFAASFSRKNNEGRLAAALVQVTGISRSGLLQALDADHGFPAPVVRYGTIEHFDLGDAAFPPFQIERLRVLAASQDVAHRDVVGLAVGVDHLDIEYLDGGAARMQPDGLEAAFPAADAQDVTVHVERDRPAPEVDPGASARAGRGDGGGSGRPSGQSFDADHGVAAPVVRDGTVEHFDPGDVAFPPSQIERRRAAAAPQDVAHRDVFGLAVAVDHLDIEHL